MTARTRKISFLITQITDQQKWIEQCEQSPRSYTGPNGPAIRQADVNALRGYESELASLRA